MEDLHPAFPRATDNAVDHFRPLIAVITAVAHGDERRRAEVEYLLPQLDNNGWQLGAATHRIWGGERDGAALSAGLDANSAAVVAAILQAVEQPDAESDQISAIMATWRPVILTVAAAALDIDQARSDIEGFLPQLESEVQWITLAQRIRRLLAGDPSRSALLEGLDPTDTVIMSAILYSLEDRDNLMALLRTERDRAAAEDESNALASR